jgi:fructosamine-3-kinase
MTERALLAALEQRLGARCLRASRLSGGDICSAFCVEVSGLGRVFVKTHPRAPRGLFSAEAAGLEWLRAPGGPRVPKVLAISEDGAQPAYLALEFLEQGRPARDHDEQLGRGLAALHRAAPASFGFDRDNFIGPLPQPNAPVPRWAEFYRERRLEPQLARAVQSGAASFAMRRKFERLFERLPELVGPEEPPARLHGDLWGGNSLVGPAGEPCLIDPAVYGGHREVDLAMMRLFGGFSERVFSAYAEAWPLADGAAERVALYQMYPLLVHTNLFGGSYVNSVERALDRYV